jgi:hypothetical protein
MRMHVPSVALYLVSSVCVMYTNRQARFHGVLPCHLLLTQAAVMLLIVSPRGPLDAPSCALGALNALNVWVGIAGLMQLSLAMFTALRRLVIVLVFLGELVLFDAHVSVGRAVCVCIITVAVFVTAADAEFVPAVHVNNALTVAGTLLSRHVLKHASKDTVLRARNLVQIVFALALCSAREVPTRGGLAYVAVSTACGAAIQYSTLWSIERNGGLTQSVVGSLKNVGVGLLSCYHIIDTDYAFTSVGFAAIQVTAIASVAYVCLP